jgi:hypothetical protein
MEASIHKTGASTREGLTCKSFFACLPGKKDLNESLTAPALCAGTPK